jgi:hypothetical protein
MDHSNIQIHSTVGGMSNDYKAAKEAFVLGMMDSSITHVNLVSLVALTDHPLPIPTALLLFVP